MANAKVRVTVHLRPEEGFSWDEGLISHDLQAVINDVFVEREIVGVFIHHLNWFTGGRAYIDGPEDHVSLAWRVMQTDPRLSPFFSRTVVETGPRLPGPNEEGWNPKH